MSYVSIPAPRLLDRVADVLLAPLRAFGRALISVGESSAQMRRIDTLVSMSDSELAERGLSRDQIARHLYGNRLYF